MSFFKVKIDKADRIFGYFIKERDNWRCVRCHAVYDRGSQAFNCSHYFGRAHENTRFDPKNCDGLCVGCHNIWESDEYGEYEKFKIKQLGQKGFELLMFSSTLSVKKERENQYVLAKQMLKNLLEERGVDFNSYIKQYKL